MQYPAANKATNELTELAKLRNHSCATALLLSLALLSGCDSDSSDSAGSETNHFHTTNNYSNTEDTGIDSEIKATPSETTILYHTAEPAPEHIIELSFHTPNPGTLEFSEKAGPARNIQFIPALDSLINMNINHTCPQQNSEGSSCYMSFQTSHEEITKLNGGLFSGSVVADNAEPLPISIQYLGVGMSVPTQDYLTYSTMTLSQANSLAVNFNLSGLNQQKHRIVVNDNEIADLPYPLCKTVDNMGDYQINLPGGTSHCSLVFAPVADSQDPLGEQQISSMLLTATFEQFNTKLEKSIQLSSQADLYLGGEFLNVGNIAAAGLASWDGTQWTAIDTRGDQYVNADMVLHNGRLYIPYRGFTVYNDEGSIYNWDGNKLTIHTKSFAEEAIATLFNFDNKLYLGGQFSSFGNISVDTDLLDLGGLNFAQNVAQWDPKLAKWISVGGGVTEGQGPGAGNDARVNKFAVFNGKLYMGGDFAQASGQPVANIAYLDDGLWKPVAAGVSQPVQAMTVHNNQLCVAGSEGVLVASGKAPFYVSCWDGNQWTSLTENFPTDFFLDANEKFADVRTLVSYNGGLYLGGRITDATIYAGVTPGNDVLLVSLDGNGNWKKVITEDGFNYLRGVNSTFTYGDSLYLTGSFSNAGGQQFANIARLDNNGNWYPLSNGILTGTGNSLLVANNIDILVLDK
jgi:hypothetical protein